MINLKKLKAMLEDAGIPKIGDNYFGYDDRFLKSLIVLHNTTVHTNDDTVILIIGEPGAGKSTLASQVGFILSLMTGKKIHFNKKPSPKGVIYFKGKSYERDARDEHLQVKQLDESYNDMSSKRAMSSGNFKFGKMLRDVRENNHFHLLLMQDLWDFEKNVVMQRADICIYCYKLPDRDRLILEKGFYRVYGRKKLKKLYLYGSKFHDMDAIRQDDGRGKFTNHFMYDEEEYRQMKSDYIREEEDEEQTNTDVVKDRNKLYESVIFAHLLKGGMSKMDAYKKIVYINKLKDYNVGLSTIRGNIAKNKDFVDNYLANC